MIKRVIPLLIVPVLFIVTSCGVATTAQDQYAVEMKSALQLLAESQDDYANLESLLTVPLDPATGVTRLQMIELYNIAAEEFQIGRDDYFSLGLNALDALVGPSIDFSKDGQEILKILLEVAPVEEIQTDHQNVLECVQTRVAFADELSSSLKELSAIDMTKAGDLVACESFDTSLGNIKAFANGSK
jgi:hypothetical protein